MKKPVWKDPARTPEERAADLLSDLSLEEKLAQLGCIFPFGEDFTDINGLAQSMPLGIGEVSTLEMRRLETLDACAAWQRAVQQKAMEQSPHGIPAIFHMEGICGPFLQDGASFPCGIGRGASWDPELEKEIGSLVSRQEGACGITHIFAPVLDVARDPRMGRTGESYSEDPTLCAVLGAAYVEGVQRTATDGRHPESVAKHFLAFHTAQGGIHGAHSEIPARPLREIFAKPFQAAIQAGLRAVMPCYCVLNGEPVSASKEILTDLLREEMGFDGLCLSDYGAVSNTHSVQHLGETMGEAGLTSLEAGMDMELPSVTAWGEELKKLLDSGKADMALVDRAVLRVLTAKFRMGLFEHPFAMEGKPLHDCFPDSIDYELSLRSAEASIVLLKNDGILPLEPEWRKIAVIGPHADCPRKLFGGYTHLCMMESTYAVANSIAGVAGVCSTLERRTIPGTDVQADDDPLFDDILDRQKPDTPSILSELRRHYGRNRVLYAQGYPVAGADQSGFKEALEICRKCEVVILTLGGRHGTCSMATMGEGVDSTDIGLPPCQEAFLREVAKLDKPVIGIHVDGRPISSDAADEVLCALLEAWSPAEAGAEAIVNVLLGIASPEGRLPVSVARSAGQVPIYYNHPWGSMWHQGESIGFANYVNMPHTPRYPFGYGLTYTSFKYSNLTVTPEVIGPEGTVSVSVVVKNTGYHAGTEVVQLYLQDEYASVVRPVQELAGFCKVSLESGEYCTVTFTLHAAQTAFLDKDMRWKVEKGRFLVRAGGNSEAIQQTGVFTVSEDGWVDGKSRPMIAQASVSETSKTDERTDLDMESNLDLLRLAKTAPELARDLIRMMNPELEKYL